MDNKQPLLSGGDTPVKQTKPKPEDNGCPLVIEDDEDKHPPVGALLRKYVCGQACQVWLGMLWLLFAQISDVLYPLQFGLALTAMTTAS